MPIVRNQIDAMSPLQFSAREYWSILKRTYSKSEHDNISLLAAGVAFYAFLTVSPASAAIILGYGVFADPATVVDNIRFLAANLPADVAALIADQLVSIASGSEAKKGFGLIVAIAVAVYGATKSTSATITALNVCYGEAESRSFIRLKLTTIAITSLFLLLAMAGFLAAAASTYFEVISPPTTLAGKFGTRLFTLVALLIVASFAAALMFRVGPDREDAKWRWVTPGSGIAAILWVAVTSAFSAYAANVANFGATYGALGAVVGLMTWLYLSVYLMLMGCALNAQLELQTAHDTTIGPVKPIGSRGAIVADNVIHEV